MSERLKYGRARIWLWKLARVKEKIIVRMHDNTLVDEALGRWDAAEVMEYHFILNDVICSTMQYVNYL